MMKRAPSRLAFTGRLEKMKGANDLIAIAQAWDRGGRDFQLDICGGTGGLESQMRAALNDAATAPALRERVRIRPPVDFDRDLVPWLRSQVVLMLSPSIGLFLHISRNAWMWRPDSWIWQSRMARHLGLG
jgi:hypothetical protein